VSIAPARMPSASVYGSVHTESLIKHRSHLSHYKEVALSYVDCLKGFNKF
jgi:hypothetical protein